MRTKALLGLTALAVTAMTAVAQSNVYSLNIVGYVNVPVSGGFNVITDQLKTGTNGANEVLPSTDNSQVLKWNGAGFDTWFYDSGFGGWIDAGFNSSIPKVNPGEGFFYFNPGTATTITFVGEVACAPASSTTNVVGGGFRLVGSKVPFAGAVDSTTVALPVQDNMQVLQWNGTGYNTWFYDSGFGGWIDAGFNAVPAPQVAIGQGFFYFNPGTPVNWVQSLP